MSKFSKSARSYLFLFLAMALVPVTIDACSGGGGGEKAKDKFQIVMMIGLISPLALAGRSRSEPQAQQVL